MATNSYLNTDIESSPRIKDLHPPLDESNQTSIEYLPFTIIPELNMVNRCFVEHIRDRLISQEKGGEELLEGINRFKDLFTLIESNLFDWEYLRHGLTLLSRIYTFRRVPEVSAFLENEPSLIPSLVEARKQIESYFGDVELVIEVITEPEAADDRELVVFIRADLPPDEALRKLEQLDEDWWLDASTEVEGKLCIHVEFK